MLFFNLLSVPRTIPVIRDIRNPDHFEVQVLSYTLEIFFAKKSARFTGYWLTKEVSHKIQNCPTGRKCWEKSVLLDIISPFFRQIFIVLLDINKCNIN